MSTSAQRILARHVLADTIGDPIRMLAQFKDDVAYIARFESKLPEFRRLDKELKDKRVFELARTTDFWKQEDPESKDLQAKFQAFVKDILDFQLVPKFAFQRLKGHHTENLFLAILQNMSLPPKTLKKVEMCAKFYARSRVLPSTRENAVETYAKILDEYRKHLQIVEEALKLGQPHGEMTQTKMPAGSFTLVNTGGFDTETMIEAVAVVEKAEKLMRAIGMGYTCYGEILISKRLAKADILAFYLTAKDEMFIRADLKGKGHDAVRTVCHELAHRAHFRFLIGKDSMMKRLYQALKDFEPSFTEMTKIKEQVNIGDQIPYKGEMLTVSGMELGRSYNWVVKLTLEGERHTFRMPLKAYAEAKGLMSAIGKFVSRYAQTAYDENFAEMVAVHALGQLPQDQVEALEAIILKK